MLTPEVYRLGFGTADGITKLKSHADAKHFPLLASRKSVSD